MDETRTHSGPAQKQPALETKAETWKERHARHRRRVRLYLWSFALVGLIVILCALVVANTRAVRLDWVVGSIRASLIWIILASAIFGWLAGLVTGIVFRHHTRPFE
jgi:uncharacterized integral membrane protein